MQSKQGHTGTLTLPASARRDVKKPFDYGGKKPGSQRMLPHDKEILDLIKSKALVELSLMSGNSICGNLISSDKYTIKINSTGADGKGTYGEFVYFKHSIEGFGKLNQGA